MTNSDPTIRKQFEAIPRDATLGDLMDWCVQHQVAPHRVVLTGGHMVIQRPETDAERQIREDFQAERERRTEAWERETYERLRTKFGQEGQSA